MSRPSWLGSWGVVRRFVPLLRAHTRSFTVVGGLSVATAGLELLRPWPIQWVVDHALVPTTPTPAPFGVVVGGAVAALAVITLGHAALTYVRTLRLAQVLHTVVRDLRQRVFARLAALPPGFHARHKTGDLLVRMMGDVPMVGTMMAESSVEVLTRGLLIAATAAVMLAVDPLLAAVVLGIVPLLLVAVRLAAHRIAVAVRKQRRKEGALADFAHEALAATVTVQALGGTDHVVRRFARGSRRSERAGLRAKRLAARLSVAVESLLGIAVATTLAFGSWRVAGGSLSPGELLVFLSYLRGLLKPIRAASRHTERIGKGTACAERLLDILDTEPGLAERPDAVPAPVEPTRLHFEAVGFAYPDGTSVLRGFEATFRRGELSAIVGESGAGKSTLAALASRLQDPSSGSVRLDGIDLRAIQGSSLRRTVGLCLQETALFGDTIRENLLLAAPAASDAAIWEALEAAEAARFVRALPDGLDTTLGSSGAGLSGGERRRLALARTLLRGGDVLLVDEPYAGLDAAAAAGVRATLRAWADDHIVIVITHDLTWHEAYDQVLVLDRGRVAARGNHADLLRTSPRYRQVVAPALAVAGGAA